MEIIDAQIHTWMSDRPTRPWTAGYREGLRDRLPHLIHAGQNNTNEMAVMEMAGVGVDAALLSPVGVYGADNSYEFEGVACFPRKLRVVGWVDWLDADLEERLAESATKGLVGVRVPEMRNAERHERGEFDRLLEACQKLHLVVSVMFAHPVPAAMIRMLEKYPGINFVAGHLGLDVSPPVVGALADDPFEKLPPVLELSRLANLHLNLTGTPSMSRVAYPFRDIWPAIDRVMEAFGPDRLMWGSDYTRTAGLHSYWEGTHYLREVSSLSDDDRARIYGTTLRRVFDWTDTFEL
jgi:predicted TIM-barrel fold metal-dependent hydrolase